MAAMTFPIGCHDSQTDEALVTGPAPVPPRPKPLDSPTATTPSPEAARAPMVPATKGSLVLALNEVTATLPLVKGNGASLARMARADFPVSPGCRITTDAYRAFLDANALQASIVALAKDATGSSEETSKEIRELFDPAGILPVKPRINLSFRP